ncbi:MAG: ABC transporter permease [Acidobacteriota bacterium]
MKPELHDLRFAVRSLTRSWGFTLLAIASLGLGLGANTALFSLVDALLLRSLPVADPARLVLIQRMTATGKPAPLDATSLDVIRGLTDIYSDAAMTSALPSASVAIDNAPEPSRQVLAATPSLFTTLGVTAQAGRLEPTDSNSVAVISDSFWRARFAADRSVIGRALAINGETYPIAGVAAPGFLGVSLDSAGDIWVLQSGLQSLSTFAIARLRPGISLDQATAATAAPLDNLDHTRSTFASVGPAQTAVIPGGQGTSNLRERYRAPLIALMGLVALVLLVTCANLANLLVVRNVSRVHELRVRTALGAGRTRLIRQLVMEGLVLAIIGGGFAWFCARQIVDLLLSTIPSPEAAARLAFHADARVLAFMGAATLLTLLGFAVLPAWRASRVDAAAALKASPGQDAPHGARRLGLVMVGVQVALSVVLLTAAAMFAQTVRNVATMPLGFDRQHLVEVELADRVLRVNAAQVRDIHDALVDGIRALPGVEHVALSHPLFPSWAFGIEQPAGEAGTRVSVDYFAAMKIPLLRGRLLTPADLAREDPVVVVNEWYARGWFPGEDAIGKRGGFNQALIVGIVGNANTTNVRWEEPAVYRFALPSEARLAQAIHVRTAPSIDPASLFRPIEEVVRRVNPRLLVAVRTPDDALNRSIARERMLAATSGFFGLTGLALAGIGLFGVAAAAVANRISELGLRIALGASRWSIIRDALRGTAIVFSGGLVMGVVVTTLAARQLNHAIAGLLIGLRSSDWMTVAAAAAAMIVVAILAALLPAWRAARADPLVTMRTN